MDNRNLSPVISSPSSSLSYHTTLKYREVERNRTRGRSTYTLAYSYTQIQDTETVQKEKIETNELEDLICPTVGLFSLSLIFLAYTIKKTGEGGKVKESKSDELIY